MGYESSDLVATNGIIHEQLIRDHPRARSRNLFMIHYGPCKARCATKLIRVAR